MLLSVPAFRPDLNVMTSELAPPVVSSDILIDMLKLFDFVLFATETKSCLSSELFFVHFHLLDCRGQMPLSG